LLGIFFEAGDDFDPPLVSDLLHLMKNARFRIPMGFLGMEGTTSTIIPGARKPFDLLKDDLAIRIFAIENRFALWDPHDAAKAYSLLPFVYLSLTVRCPRSSIDAHPDLL
jgi:hypothetical protein